MNEGLENMDDDFGNAYDPSDFKEEFEMWKLLAEQEDNAEAQLRLGQMYQYGFGVKEDDREAVKWYGLAAEQGNAEAQHSLGAMYENTKDHEKALIWYWLSAQGGYAEGQLSLGAMYYKGEGVAQDYKEACNWYLLSAEHEEMAQCKLTAMNNKGGLSQFIINAMNKPLTF